MKQKLLFIALFNVFISLLITSNSFAQTFPADARIIDVTKAPYFAKGDGVTDDTDAINLALRQNNASSPNTPTNFMSRTIYLPTGTYLVSKSLEPINISDVSKNECSVRIIGDGIDRTIIKLKDGSTGFGLNALGNQPAAINAKYVLRTGNKNGGLPNAGFGNYIQNLTVDIGSNVGAGGIRFDVANCGSMAHVKIVSSSGSNGVYGLGFFKQVGSGYVKDVTVKGFAYGIYMDDIGVNNITMEHITLKNQGTAGIDNEGKNIQIRDLKSDNTVPAIIANKEYAATILLSATLAGGSSSTPAIKLVGTTSPVASPFLFARDVTSSGYSATIDVPAGFAKADVTTAYVAEWATHDNPLSRGGSLNLPIEDAPEYNTTDLSKWAGVVTYGATPDPTPGNLTDNDVNDDDAIGIQAAIDNATTEIVYFPYGVYDIKSDVVVRGTVKKIDFLFSQIRDVSATHFIRVENTTASQQIILENMVLSGVGLIQNSSRTLVVRNFGGGGKITTGTNGGGKFYVETAGPHCNIEVRNGMSAWLRAVNRERVAFLNDGSTVWDFGDNIERMETDATGNQIIGPFTTMNGGKSEYFGGAVDALDTKHIPSDGPLFLTDQSTLSAVYAGEYRDDGIWPLHFRSISSAGATEVDSSATIVIRYTPTSSSKRFFMPLYSVNTEPVMIVLKIVSVAAVPPVVVPVKTIFSQLPFVNQVEVTYDNNTKGLVGITYSPIGAYNQYLPGTYPVLGTLVPNRGTINPNNIFLTTSATIRENIYLTNTFSPNGDGKNDTWLNPELRFYRKTSVEIINRDGKQLFYSTDPNIGWDGKNKNGEIVTGSYFYIINVPDLKLIKRGVVTVIK